MYKTLFWTGDACGQLHLLDQTQLPTHVGNIICTTADDTWHAIRKLQVRGAPAIGVAAAYGLVLGLQGARNFSLDEFLNEVDRVAAYLSTSRPTAVNLFWALDRMQKHARSAAAQSAAACHDYLLAEARQIEAEDQAMCSAIGRHGSPLLSSGMSILTHCNAGALATAGDGTALAIMFQAAAEGKQIHVFADETRPLLQGARLTTWELQQRGIPVTLICDNMAAQVMKEGRVQIVITGADRIAANGDAANKIGTYGVAVLAKYHGIPFCIAAPSSTFDLSLPDGNSIPIENRATDEVVAGFGKQTAPEKTDVYNPAFDVTPSELITAIITENGIIRSPTTAAVLSHLTQTG
ncbi:MAG: S-methyl-5-thioribose-1-phosphate isomerase [Planctomycetaceae bacterium]